MQLHDSGARCRLPRLLAAVFAGVLVIGAVPGCQATGDAPAGAEGAGAAAAPAPAGGPGTAVDRRETAAAAAAAAETETETATPEAAEAGPGELEPAAEPPRQEIDIASLVPVAIPPDGAYGGLQVDGAPVPSVHILGKGRTVQVREAGFRRAAERVIMEFSSDGAVPNGYFNSSRVDSNADGDLRDELIKRGLWKMDERGNITRLQ